MPIENILLHRILSLAHMCHSDTVSNMLDSNVVPTPGERSAGMVEEEKKNGSSRSIVESGTDEA